MTIEESKDLTSLSLDELIRSLKVHEMIIKKDSKIVKAKVERKSLAIKAKKKSSDEECSTSRSKDEEYAMAVRDFKKFFKRRGRFVRQPRNEKRYSKEAVMTRTVKVIENALDAANQIILLENVQNHQNIRTKELLSEVHGVIAVKKNMRMALNPKWRANIMAIKELKDLTSLSLDEFIRNLKVHEMIIKKDSEIRKAKVERKSLALKAKKESGDEECLTFGSKDEEYTMAVKDFKKFFRRRGRFVRQPRNDKKTFQRSHDNKNGKSDRKCFRYRDLNHLIGECPKPPKDKNQRAFIRGSWSDSGGEDDEKVNNETCLVAQASSEESRRTLNVKFDETHPPFKTPPLVDDDLDKEVAIKVTEKKNLENDNVDETLEIDEIVNIKESKNHPLENVIGNLN
nr:serine/threonine protein kinase SRPK1 [Tanacetum cinerariifolium]